MTLNELFVSHKQVDPVKFESTLVDPVQDLYLNLARAQQAVSSDNTDHSDETWRVKDEEDIDSDEYNWTVRYRTKYPDEITTPEVILNSTFTSTTIPHSATQQKSDEIKAKSKSKSKTGTKSSTKWSNNPYKGNRELWKRDMLAAYKSIGLSDNAAKNLLAKNALESGWGQYAQGDFNFGNITTGNYWNGRYVQGDDKNAYGKRISQKFRAYDSLKDYVKDEVDFLKRLYDFDENDDFETFMYKLQGGNKDKRKYAESRSYITSVRNVYNELA